MLDKITGGNFPSWRVERSKFLRRDRRFEKTPRPRAKVGFFISGSVVLDIRMGGRIEREGGPDGEQLNLSDSVSNRLKFCSVASETWKLSS